MLAGTPEPLALDELGWCQFFDLCAGVLELGTGVRPGAWVGEEDSGWHTIVPAGLELAGCPALAGPCYVSSVWVPDGAGAPKSLALEQELAEVRDAAAAEGADGSVVILTNYAGLFADRSRLRDFFGSDRVILLGPAWLSQRVDASARLRRAMPSLLGLGDLDRWLPSAVRSASTLDVGAARALSQVFVPTKAYARALAVLEAHRFTVLTGPPEMGKTAIARMIALALMTEGWEAFECTTPEQIAGAFDRGRQQVFVADDAFGSTEFRPEAAERWARELEHLLQLMDGDHWLIWTSRPAPLRAGLGRIHRERGAERFPQPGEVLVDASALSLDEKVLILLRHAKAACGSRIRRALRLTGYTIISHPHFTPERIRRLVATDAVVLAERLAGGDELDAVIAEQIRTPTEAMAASFRALSYEHQALLYALLDAPPGPVEERELAHLARRHRPEGLSRAPTELVDRLTDHFLRVTETLKVDWVHPSWRDLVIDRLREDAPAREAFLQRCTLEGVMLALATAGGATGARSLALVVTDRDWDLVTDQVVRAAREASDADVTRMLDAIAVAAGDAARLGAPASFEAQAVARAALTATRTRCDRTAETIDLDVLTAWFALAQHVPEAGAAPCSDRTWTELLPGERTDLRIQREVDQAIAWLTLARLLGQHEPRRLTAYGFPDRHRQRMQTLLAQADALHESEPRHAGREQLIRLLVSALRDDTEGSVGRLRLGAHRESELEPMWDAWQDAGVFSDVTVRRHVERILEDL